jgi:hypothetical protein
LPRSLAAHMLPAECVPINLSMDLAQRDLALSKASHRMPGMLQGGQSSTPRFEELLTHLPSCAFVQFYSSFLQSMAKTGTFTCLSCTHKSDWLQCSPRMLTSPGGACCSSRWFHAMRARRWPFGMICLDQGTSQPAILGISSLFSELLSSRLFSP